MIKKLLKNILVFLNGIRVFPLWLLYQIKSVILKDSYAKLFEKDIDKYKLGFFQLLYVRPYFKMILYHRLGFISRVLEPICGTYSLYILDCEKMLIGGG